MTAKKSNSKKKEDLAFRWNNPGNSSHYLPQPPGLQGKGH